MPGNSSTLGNLGMDGTGDPDGDGEDNLSEFRSNTVPAM
jgi:hypothetical protein